MSRLRKILLSLAVVAGLILVAYVFSHFQKKGALEAYKRQLKTQGEKLTIAELIPPLPTNGPNAADALLAIVGQLRGTNTNPWFSRDSNNCSPMLMIRPGHARAAWQRQFLPSAHSTNVWPGLIREIQERQAAFGQAHVELASPVLYFHVNYELGPNAPLAHLGPLRAAAKCLSYATIVDLHQDHSEAAWENLKACVNLACLDARNEPVVFSQQTRVGISQVAFETAWEALQYPKWTETQLAELQNLWSSFQLLDELDPTLAMQRALDQRIFEMARDSFDDFHRFSGSDMAPTPDEYPHYLAWKWRWSYDEELCRLKYLQAALETVRNAVRNKAFAQPMKELGKAYTNIFAEELKSSSRYMWIPYQYSQLETDKLLHGSFLYSVIGRENQRRLLVTAISLKRYQLHNGKYPDQLGALVPDFLTEMPIDIMDGKPLRYRPTPDGNFRLYSVGEDGVDNGGDPNPTDPKGSLAWWRARDAVWPMPASPEEIQAYEDKLASERKSPGADAQSEKFRRRYGRYLQPSNLKTN